MKWHQYVYEERDATAPPEGELVWVLERYYLEGVGIGYYDGYTMRMWSGSDDCGVTHWARIQYPKGPAPVEVEGIHP
jgi:predicted SnoaL-like aldol condensation-catalyzing enzyme